MNNQKKVLALVIPSMKSGGMERVMSVLANFLAKFDNCNVHLVLYGKSPEIFYNLDQKITIYKPRSGFNKKLRIIGALKRLIYLRKTIKQIEPDTVLSFGTLWNSFVLLALKGTPYPVFVSDRGNPHLRYSFFHEYVRKNLYKNATGIIAQTSVARDMIIKRLPSSNVVVIGNPIRKIDTDTQQLYRAKVVLSVGPLKATKNHDRLIHIFSKLNAPDWNLIIVGGNALKQNNYIKLQGIITELKLNDKVILAGEKYNVEEYYLRSRIFAFTSSTEGFPNVVGEALSSGLPVISYDCITGPSEMIRDGENGYLVPVFDDILFQKRLQFLIDNEDIYEKMSVKAKQSVNEFDVENIGKKYYSFITSLS